MTRFAPTFFWISVFVGGGVNVEGRDVIWRGLPFSRNETSDAQVMDSSYAFELGVFTNGFVPTIENLPQWKSHWVAAGSANYNTSLSAFSGSLTVVSNSAPFFVGAKAYVWGKSIGSNRSEWILFRGATWTWPAPDTQVPPNPTSNLTWSTTAADEVVLGAIHNGGGPFHMKSSVVFSYEQWMLTQLSGNPLNAPNEDADGDGYSNLLEFIFGTSPVTPSNISMPAVLSGGYLQMTIPRLRNRLANFTVQVSGDLSVWNSGLSHTAVTGVSENFVTIRDLIQQGTGTSRRFMRLKAELVKP